ncbi:MAG TPA: transglycosylase domain-containing protein [Oscillospiraceae bacterium]|nr:transglycosylase domain-containing protein [Oscillospiraceae bacterium]
MKSEKKKITAAGAADATARVVGGTASTVLKVIGTILLIFITSMLLFFCIFAYYVKTSLTPSIGLKLSDFTLNQSSTIVYEAEDGTWQELTTLSGKEKRVWVDYGQIPKNFEHAIVAIEDKRFYKHQGVDWYRSVGAFFNMFLGMRNDFGGSTITQQLIKNITKQDDITVQRKLLEIFQALDLEKKYSKEEIIEWYLNVVYFGEGSYGVQAAAQTYFGKDAADLDLAECAAIAGITNLPTYYDPFYSKANNKKRQETILYQMYDQNYISKDEYESAKAEDLKFVRGENEEYTQTIYTYYEETVISDVVADLMKQQNLTQSAATTLLYNGGYTIYSCIDPSIQAKVDAVYTNLDALPKAYANPTGQQLQSAIVIMDPKTGAIVALSGGTGQKAGNFLLNRATGTKRPPGSSIKPIAIYGPAVEYGLITPSTLVLDAKSDIIHLSGTSWYPKNSGGGNAGIITIAEGLRRSLNTVSAQILDKLTPQASYEFLINRLGVTSLVSADCDYAPLALGQLTNGITVREMAQAYSALDNDGVFTYSRTYSKVTQGSGSNEKVILQNDPVTIQAFSANTAHVMTYMLQNAAHYGTGSEAWLGNNVMPIAGKTGTTTADRDRWFCGYTPYYVATVWTGYDTPAAMSISGNPAAQIWKKIMGSVSEGMTYTNFPSATLGSPTGIFGTREEMEKLLNPDKDEGGGDATATESPTVSTSPTDITQSPTPNTVVNDILNTIFH